MAYNSRHTPSRGASYRPMPRDYRNDRNDRNDRDNRDSRNNRDSRDNRDTRSQNGPPPRDAYRQSPYGGRNDNSTRYSREGAPPPVTYSGPPGVDNYRLPQGDFTFRVDKPAGVQEADNYRPQDSRNFRNDRREPYDHRDKRPRGPHDRPDRPFRNGPGPRSSRGGFARGGRPWRPFVAAERELLKTEHSTGSEVAYFDTTGGVTYRALEDLSDSDEAEMDISGDEAEAAAEPSNKRARLSVAQSASADDTPKWSNPDPYTALPPETTPQTKKKDVVQLIRKARVPTKDTRTSLPSDTADFISLDFDDSDGEVDLDTQEPSPVRAADPAPPPTLHAAPANLQLPPKPPAPPKPAKAPAPYPDPTPSALGSRKRTHDDEIKMPHTRLKKATKAPVGGGIVSEWRPQPGMVSTPWLTADHSQSASMAVWLHKETVDFYDYIKPRDFEERLRSELVEDLKKFCRQAFRDAEVYPFGSFPSGLYLPTADMDMVFMSDRYAAGGAAKYFTKTFLHRFKGQLLNYKLAWENEVELILHAKVPLAKFIDHRTGLKVDISFENSTGLTAIDTFMAWKEQYPGMPALVTLIKHFLLMRGLNEPVNGGIGGFSVICLVVSMLQMMPEVQSGNLDTRRHLGQLLLHFFDLYGNKFNYQTVAISLNPPKYIPKHQVATFAYKDHNRLSIIDPNNPANDIAGGSSNTGTVLSLFADAHEDLTRRMAQLAQDPNKRGQSILGVIMGGNYSTFSEQRDYLELLSKPGYRHVVPQPPPQKAPQGRSERNRRRK